MFYFLGRIPSFWMFALTVVQIRDVSQAEERMPKKEEKSLPSVLFHGTHAQLNDQEDTAKNTSPIDSIFIYDLLLNLDPLNKL